MSKLSRCYTIDDLATLAKEGLYDFIDRRAEDEVTTRENNVSIKLAMAMFGCKKLSEFSRQHLQMP